MVRLWLRRIDGTLAWLLLASAMLLAAGCGRNASLAAPPQANATPSLPVAVQGPPAAPAELRAYRYLLAVDVTDVSGAPSSPAATDVAQLGGSAVAPAVNRIIINLDGEVSGDRQRTRLRADVGIALIDNERIQIGARAWSREGGAAWHEEPPGGAVVSGAFGLDTAATTLLGTGLDNAGAARTRRVLSGLRPTPDRLGGTEALRYLLEAREIAEMFGGTPGDSPFGLYKGQAQFWVTREGLLPLRLVLGGNASGQLRAQLDITDQNSNEIVIQPPA
ncbi:MAG: hypothetical protein EXR68_00430 [Dehalococcoidia bacterium]|nr:hypothetical protein [Dehalococcoidia bacterium]